MDVRVLMLQKEETVVKMDKQTRTILLITIGTVSLTIVTVYIFGVLLPSLKQFL